MRYSTRKQQKLFIVPGFILLGLLYACNQNTTSKADAKSEVTVNKVKNQLQEIAVAPPPLSEGIFPCSECHAYQETNPNRRELVDMHDDISAMFDHDSANRWCLDCHNADNRDFLHLASGKLLTFEESYKLCGQCHGDKLRDWKVGVHGKRTGEWNGTKQYLLCVNCHNPHSPKFRKLAPKPPPLAHKNLK